MFRLIEISGEDLRAFRDSQHPEANLLQSPEWGAAQASASHPALHYGIAKGDDLVGAMLIIPRIARRGRYLEIPGGPLIDWSDTKLAQFTINSLRQLGRKHRAVSVRLRPQVVDTATARADLRRLGLRHASWHLNAEHTNILDLRQTEAELLAKMRRQTRYEVRQALKQDIKVAYATDAKAFRQFHAVQQRTAARQHFLAPSQRELLKIHEAFGPDARIYTASAAGKPLSYGLIVISGREADYLEAASELEARNHPTAYGLHWQVIRDLQALGIERYNLWGIAYTSDPKHRYAQVTTFKNGFGGDKVAYVPAHDLVLKPLRYVPIYLLETLRRKLRHL